MARVLLDSEKKAILEHLPKYLQAVVLELESVSPCCHECGHLTYEHEQDTKRSYCSLHNKLIPYDKLSGQYECFVQPELPPF